MFGPLPLVVALREHSAIGIADQITNAKSEGVDVISDCHWQMFGMGDLAEKGSAIAEHEVNAKFSKVANMFAMDKKETRDWSEDDEKRAGEIFRKLIEAREKVISEMSKLPRYMKHKSAREDNVRQWEWMEISPEARNRLVK